MELVWFAKARRERGSQLAYIASHNVLAAIDAGLRLREAVERLTSFPHSGRPGRTPETRELIVPHTSFIVVYAVDAQADEIHVLRILHARQKNPPE